MRETHHSATTTSTHKTKHNRFPSSQHETKALPKQRETRKPKGWTSIRTVCSETNGDRP
jgi:hypothetical protein